jgi:hypothetical protein
VSDDDAANRRGNDNIYRHAFELVCQEHADLLGIARVLQHKRALKVLTAMQARRQLEVPGQKSAGRDE